ncbi:MAG: hypothetical protein JNM14_13345 [Ferruginibacter sp.]|nr:hypothetical protein [Ferruginibacter sp.]
MIAKHTIADITIIGTEKIVKSNMQVMRGDIIEVNIPANYTDGLNTIFLVGWAGTETDQGNSFKITSDTLVTIPTNGDLFFKLIYEVPTHEMKVDANGFAIIEDLPTEHQGLLDFETIKYVISVTKTPSLGEIKIGSVVTLRNNGFLDTWGFVKDRPDFSMITTETMFVLTHKNPNRDNGSGSWEILSAEGKENGAPLLYGDKVYLKNKYPGAGYLDTCWPIKDLPVYKAILDDKKSVGVFTSGSNNRDNGSGTWTVKPSSDRFNRLPVHEGNPLFLENGYPGAGFLTCSNYTNHIDAFKDYGSARVVSTWPMGTGTSANAWNVWLSDFAP